METWEPRGRVLSPELEPDVRCAAAGDAQVLISGKPDAAEWLARVIHRRSPRADGPFLVFDAALQGPEAARALRSILEERRTEAQAGTLFLRNVSHASREVQVVLRDWFATRPEMTRPRLRIIGASTVWLLERVQAGSFDDRLFYRLNTIHITINGWRAAHQSDGDRDLAAPPSWDGQIARSHDREIARSTASPAR